MERRDFISAFASYGAAAIGALVLGPQALVRAAEKPSVRLAPNPTGAQARVSSRFPNVVLQTHDNRSLRFYDDMIKDKHVVLTFMYSTCADVCPVQTANLVHVQKLLGERIGKDIFMYTITLTPEHDTPEVLAKYRERFGVGAGWEFLTGSEADIDRIRRAVGFTDRDPVRDRDKSNHIGNVLVGNDVLDRWSACPGWFEAQQLAESILWLEHPQPMRTA